MPTAASNLVGADGAPTAEFYRLLKTLREAADRDPNILESLTVTGAFSAGSAQVAGADVLTTAANKTITAGFAATESDHGTPSNGATITPSPLSSPKQKVTNNVAGFTIAATSQIGDLELRVINGSSAGTISFSGFDVNWPGDPLTTTNGHQFVIFIFGFDGKQAYTIKKLQ